MYQHILVVGSGVREAIIIKKLLRDSEIHFNKNKKKKIRISCLGTNKNPFIDENCDLYIVEKFSVNNLLELIERLNKKEKIDFGIIGPENPLELGYADILESRNIPCIGPLKEYATIETSKIKAREFIEKCSLEKYSPRYTIIDNKVMIETTIETTIENIKRDYKKIVIKKDGLCGGKGVKVEDVDFDNKDYLMDELLNLKDGENLLIEDKLDGEEFSLMTMSDGFGGMFNFPPIQDNKRLKNDDLGPNTGGMGCIIDKNNTLPFLTKEDIRVSEEINKKIIEELNKEGVEKGNKVGYRGILYGSFIKSKDGDIHIIEFNARFGDPECYIALSLLKTNFYKLCNEVINGKLESDICFDKSAMIGVYMVPKNYPKETKDKYDIYINDENMKDNIIYGSVEKEGNHLYSLSSRALIYGLKGDSLYECYKKIYNKIKSINGNLYYRTDIGCKFLSNYERSGVSISRGNDALKEIKGYIQSTYSENVLGKFGDFGGQFKLGNYNLVSSIDGVGTKSILVSKYLGDEGFVGLGKDIVNHSVNDILVQGAYPLFFLDYFGTAHLKMGEIKNFIKGVSEACIENGPLPLIGGETAEMPSIYIENRTDLVGCIIGIKDDNLLKDVKINNGDILIGLESVSPHTNGYSLINKLIDENEYSIPNNILETLMRPHKSYLNEVKCFIKEYGCNSIKGMCHITGGGMEDNLRRIIPEEYKIEYNDIELPEWCKYISEKGNITIDEMRKVYNCGIGFVLIISEETHMKILKEYDELKHVVVGKVI